MAGAVLLALISGVVGCVFALVLRLAGLGGSVRAAGVVGGVIAGVLLGPLVMGRAMPQWHGALVTGGVEERIALDEALAHHRADVSARRALGAEDEAIEAAESAWEEQRGVLESALIAATETRDGQVRLVYAVLGGMLLGPMLGACVAALMVRRRGMSTMVAVSGGAGVVMLAALLPMGVAAFGFKESVGGAAAFGLVMATLGCWWNAAVRVRAIGAAGLAVGMGAMCALVGAAVGVEVVLVAMATAVVVGAACWWECVGGRGSGGRRRWEWIPGLVVMPMLVGVVVARMDLAAAGLDVRFIVASVLMVLFAADGRWMSISLVWRLLAGRGSGVRAWMDGARLVNAGAGMAQSAMLVLALAGGLLDAALAASAVVGVFAIELMPDLRVRVARKAALELQQE